MVDRYKNQIILPGFGKEKQNLLADKRVLVVGAGGLGCEAIKGLAAAGIGKLIILDGDHIENSNLQRQWLYCPEHVGRLKAEVAAECITHQFPVDCHAIAHYLTENNALELLSSADLVLDCTDNRETRILIDSVCFASGVPWIYAALHQTEAYWCFMNHPEASLKLCYRDLYPEVSASLSGCSEQGVFSLLPAIVGLHQATMAVRYLSGWHKQLMPGLFHYNLIAGKLRFFKLQSTILDTPTEERSAQQQNNNGAIMDHLQLRKLMDDSAEWLYLIDIRPVGEEPVLSYNSHLFPWDPSEEFSDVIKQQAGHYVLFCGSGKRSAAFLRYLSERMPAANVHSLEGGIRKEENFKIIQEHFINHA